MGKQHIGIIAGVARNNIIGNEGGIPWKIKGEQKRFKSLTMHNIVIIGSRTYISMAKYASSDEEILHGRVKIVVSSHHESIFGKNIMTACSLDDAINKAKSKYPEKDIYLIGGSRIYQEGMQYADSLYINEIKCEPEGDTVFPWIGPDIWEKNDIGSDNSAFNCYTYIRKQ